MFGRMTLAGRMYGGFALIIAIAAVLGLSGWLGVTQVRRQMDTYAAWGDIDMVMNEDVTQKILQLDNVLARYRNVSSEENLKDLHDAIDEAGRGVETWTELLDGRTELSSVAQDAAAHLQTYRQAVSAYETGLEVQTEIQTTWDRLITESLAQLETVMKDVIDPAKAQAETDQDMDQMIRWANIDMVMNEAVIANALKLQMAGHDYASLATPEAWDAFQQAGRALSEGLAEWRQTLTGETELESAATSIAARLQKYTSLSDRLRTELANQQRLGRSLRDSGASLLSKLETCMEEVIDPAKDAAIAAATSAQRRSAAISLGLTLVGIVFGTVLAIAITRGIVRPIHRIIVTLNQGSTEVADASGQVSVASQTLAEGATEQAAGLEEASSALEEMASMTKRNAETMQETNHLATDTRQSAQLGKESMNRMNVAIQEIEKSSGETARVLKVIDEIAFQTNLLALNAAVEAARAGEAGKGFAVVAEEVRNLALRSAEAARNTSQMIDESVRNSRMGVEIATEVTDALETVVQSVTTTAGLVDDIANAWQKQTHGIDQVNQSVAEMDKVTQRNAASAEESAAASEQLSAQAGSMRDIVSELVALLKGSTNQRSSGGPAPRQTAAFPGPGSRALDTSPEAQDVIYCPA